MNSSMQGAELLAAIERALKTVDASEAAFDATRGAAARGQAELEAVSDAARGLSGRGREIRASLQLVYEALERAKLSALNAGLEGGRLNEPSGRIVLQLAGDLRALVGGALEALEAHATLLGESERERERWLEDIVTARETCVSVVAGLGTLGQKRHDLRAALTELERAASPLLGADPETARLLAALSEQSRALAASVAALGARTGAPEPDRIREALAPLLDALGRVPKDEP